MLTSNAAVMNTDKSFWKLFEQRKCNGVWHPKTLVHSLPFWEAKCLKSVFPLDEWMQLDPTTEVGFNCFASLENLRDYLPRFKVRGSNLYACMVESYGPYSEGSHYKRIYSMRIPQQNWEDRIQGG